MKTPAIVYDITKLEQNLARLKHLEESCGVTILYALKASYGVLPFLGNKNITGEVSSVFEAKLAHKMLGGRSHAFFVALSEQDLLQCDGLLSHISFNSLGQAERLSSVAQRQRVSCGLRVNPRVSVASYLDYDPCQQGGRFGCSILELPDNLPDYIEGLHLHALCENGAEELRKILATRIELLRNYLPGLKWLNLGGGHLFTADDYKTEVFISEIKKLKADFPHLSIYLEPGAAFVWNAASLHTSIIDVVCNEGINTALLDVSFRAHLSDFLVGSAGDSLSLESDQLEYLQDTHRLKNGYAYRLGGSSCAACDYKEFYSSPTPLKAGSVLTFDNMGHYCDVTFSLFNGVVPPSIYYRYSDGSVELKKEYGFEHFDLMFGDQEKS